MDLFPDDTEFLGFWRAGTGQFIGDHFFNPPRIGFEHDDPVAKNDCFFDVMGDK